MKQNLSTMCPHGYYQVSFCPTCKRRTEEHIIFENSCNPPDGKGCLLRDANDTTDLWNNKQKLREWEHWTRSKPFRDWRNSDQDPDRYQVLYAEHHRKWLKSEARRAPREFQAIKAIERTLRKSQEQSLTEKFFADVTPGWPWRQSVWKEPMGLHERQCKGLARMPISEAYGGEWNGRWKLVIEEHAEMESLTRVREYLAFSEEATLRAQLRAFFGGEEVTAFQTTATRKPERDNEPPLWIFKDSKLKKVYRYLKTNRAGLEGGINVKETMAILYLYHRVKMTAPEIADYLGIKQRRVEDVIFLRSKRIALYFKKLSRRKWRS